MNCTGKIEAAIVRWLQEAKECHGTAAKLAPLGHPGDELEERMAAICETRARTFEECAKEILAAMKNKKAEVKS